MPFAQSHCGIDAIPAITSKPDVYDCKIGACAGCNRERSAQGWSDASDAMAHVDEQILEEKAHNGLILHDQYPQRLSVLARRWRDTIRTVHTCSERAVGSADTDVKRSKDSEVRKRVSPAGSS